MKKLIKLLKNCIIVTIFCLIASNIIITQSFDFSPKSEISLCAPSSNPDEDPIDDPDYD